MQGLLISGDIFVKVSVAAVAGSVLLGIIVSLVHKKNLSLAGPIVNLGTATIPIVMLLWNLVVTVVFASDLGVLQFQVADAGVLTLALGSALLATFRDFGDSWSS